jgi:lambda family phage minor tail protein L
MSDIIESVQKQDPGSELVILYDLEFTDGSFAYFHPGLDDSGTPQEIQFRDSSGTAQTYVALPIQAEGFDISSDGAYSRPTLTVANVASVFSDEIGGLDYEKLVGRRITRRMTLRKYLVGESEDSGAGNAPVEYPKTTFVIDRIKDKNILQVTFELSAPFDLAGILLPRRTIVGGACPWRYKGANDTVSKENKVGGCNWNPDKGSDYIFLNQNDEYIVPSSLIFTTYAGSATEGSYYKTANTLTRVNSDGSFSSESNFDYWQSVTGVNSTPSDTDINWRRVRIYYTYSASTTYKAYQNSDYNEYVLSSGALWQVKTVTQTGSSHVVTPPDSGIYWQRGDQCGKKLTSCSLRFHGQVSSGGDIQIARNRNLSLPFGGFPGTRVFS